MSSNFLPPNYSAPKGENSNYMKLQDGENKMRILSQPIIGWIDWDDKTPIRFPFDQKPSKPVDPLRPIRHFWAFIVWNYSLEAIQILEITQSSIREAVTALCQDEEWGQPYFYDIKITRKGKEKETTYTVAPMPKRSITPRVKEAFQAKPCELTKLFQGEDPWNDLRSPTPGIFEERDLAVSAQKEQTHMLEHLMEVVAEADMTITYVKEFVKIRAQEKNIQEADVISGALVGEMTKYFLKAYAKWLKDTGKENAEEVPF